MLLDDAELASVVPDPLVLFLRQRNDLVAPVVSALADDVRERAVVALFAPLLDLFVDLPDDGFVLGNPFLPEAQRGAPVLLQ